VFEHCGRINCICTHTNGCVKGFIDTRYVDKKELIRKGEKIVVETWYDGVLFCPTCDPERAYIQNTSRTSEEMTQRLRERSSFKQEETYKNNESSKTRTL
jgi:hypothetical protein